MQDAATVLLAHGAWCGEWVYWKLTPCLQERGIPFVGANLPSCSASDTSVDVNDDVAYVRELIDQIDGPVVVAGKSYGGAVISAASVDRPTDVGGTSQQRDRAAVRSLAWGVAPERRCRLARRHRSRA